MAKFISFSKRSLLVFGLGLVIFGLFSPSGVKAGATTGYRIHDPLPNGAYTCQGYAWSDYSPTGKYRALLYGIDAENTRTYKTYASAYVYLQHMAVTPIHDLWSPQVWINW